MTVRTKNWIRPWLDSLRRCLRNSVLPLFDGALSAPIPPNPPNSSAVAATLSSTILFEGTPFLAAPAFLGKTLICSSSSCSFFFRRACSFSKSSISGRRAVGFRGTFRVGFWRSMAETKAEGYFAARSDQTQRIKPNAARICKGRVKANPLLSQ